jgi:DHA1 family bicyclomycin/chloramphenicol resistance-like MFS transporter
MPLAPVTPAKTVGFREFVALVAALMACQALAIDTMLPALPTIANALGVTDQNHGQWIVTVYMVGLGCGQFFWGLLSDRFGRRTILLIGIAVYMIAALACALSTSFASLLALRFVHGLAAASVVVARSMVRDLYSGRQMARVMSLTFIVFLMAPIVAPSLGQLILLVGTWRELFVIFSVFAVAVWTWMFLRMPETLHPEYRLTLDVAPILSACTRVLTDRRSICYAVAVGTTFGSVIAYVSMAQQIFDQVFHRAALMPMLFAIGAAGMAVASFVNARIVGRVGMRRVSQWGLLVFIVVTVAHTVCAYLGFETLVSFELFQVATLACMGVTGSNFGAMAMEPMGSIAGIAAALQGFISTVGGAAVAALIGRYFNGSALPLAAGSAACGLVTMALVLLAERGQLFRPHHAGAEADASFGAH